MDVERSIDDIEQLEEMFEASDIRPLSASDLSAANQRHDDMLANCPWFRLRNVAHHGRSCGPTIAAKTAGAISRDSADDAGRVHHSDFVIPCVCDE